jgi:hypothetical protein
MNDLTLAEICRIEGRCIKCRQLVAQRALAGTSDDKEDYLCRRCGGVDSRVEQPTGLMRFWKRLFQ